MRPRLIAPVLLFFLAALAACHAPFSPEKIRREIVRQTGHPPQTSFEFKLGGPTMRLAKAVVSRATGEPVNFGGLTRVELAVFEIPAGRELDFTRISAWGWDTLVRTREGKRSLTVFVRTHGETLADLVLIASGEQQVLYGRLKGKLDRNLPSALDRALRATGLQGLKEHILDATRDEAPPRQPVRNPP